MIRAHSKELREVIRLRKVDPTKADLDRWLEVDERRRHLQSVQNDLNAQRNRLAELGRTDPDVARTQGRELRQKEREVAEELNCIDEEWQRIMDWFPNWVHPVMPRGSSEEDNVEESVWIPRVGYLDSKQLGRGNHSAQFMPQIPVHADDLDFAPMDHVQLAQRIGGMDTTQASKVSGSRFAYIFGDLALMQFAIQKLLTDKLLMEGFRPIIPPLLVREGVLWGTSHFPEGREQVYALDAQNVEEGNRLFLIGSSEPANFGYYMGRILSEDELPVKIFAITPCFRSEAGSWGKDVRGIKRVHQFDKLEMNAVCTPRQSETMYETFRQINEWLLQMLEIPYRVIDKCTGDAGYLATYRQRDVEVWLPGAQEFMEVMTDTNTTDYQSRRLNIRYRTEEGKVTLCHTVNDTGSAMGRMLIAILENYQQKDGSIKVPPALRICVGGDYLHPQG